MRFLSLKRLFGEDGAPSARRPRGRKARRSSPPRRLDLTAELLEDRTLMSTLPVPLTNDPVLVSFPWANPSVPTNLSTPSVAVDPLNPNKLFSAAVLHIQDSNVTEQSYIETHYSIDGGQTWSATFSLLSNMIDASTLTGTPVPYVWPTRRPWPSTGRKTSTWSTRSTTPARRRRRAPSS